MMSTLDVYMRAMIMYNVYLVLYRWHDHAHENILCIHIFI